MNAPARNNAPIKRNIKGVGLTYSNVEQQLKNHPLFNRQVTRDDGNLAFVLPTKQQICGALLQLEGNDPHHIVVAQETHKEGAAHFHVYIQWLAPHSNVEPTYFDLWGMHPRVDQIINQDNWIKYIQKEDPVPFIWVPIYFLADDDEGYTTESTE